LTHPAPGTLIHSRDARVENKGPGQHRPCPAISGHANNCDP